ncbi:hypothetical protein L9F63_011979, partial [Diploptera punctata]
MELIQKCGYTKYDVIIGKEILQITTIEQNKTNHCSRAAGRLIFQPFSPLTHSRQLQCYVKLTTCQ